jgi:putative ATP-dependent endonuclease of OLD family
MQIPVAVLTDADPSEPDAFPAVGAPLTLSAAARAIAESQDQYVRCFFAQKTLEYDLAFDAGRRALMVSALKSIHPEIGAELEIRVDAAGSDQEKAKTLFTGMFDRPKGTANVKKGRFAQALAHEIANSKHAVPLPSYLQTALDFVTDPSTKEQAGD